MSGWVRGAGLILLTLATALAAGRSTTESHVLTVLTSNEFGRSRRYTVRWEHSPRLAIIGGSDAHRQLATDIAASLSEAIAPLTIELVDDPDDADMRLYFAPPEEMPEVAASEGFTHVPGNDGIFWTWWGLGGALNQTVIIVTDAWPADSTWMRHLLLEEMTQSMGLMNDSTAFPQSVFFETSSNPGSAMTLPPLDLKTIALLYSLPPKTRKWRVRRAFRRKWEKLPPPMP